jgi:hypothetical protein
MEFFWSKHNMWWTCGPSLAALRNNLSLELFFPASIQITQHQEHVKDIVTALHGKFSSPKDLYDEPMSSPPLRHKSRPLPTSHHPIFKTVEAGNMSQKICNPFS